MGKLQQVSLSYFRNKGIDYYLCQNEKIIFPCFYCNNEAELETNYSNWRCGVCNKSGTLIDLIKSEKSKETIKIYHPKQEHWEINTQFRKIIDKYGDIPEIIKLQQKSEKLVKYLLKKANIH